MKKTYCLMVWLKKSEPMRPVTHLNYQTNEWKTERGKKAFIIKTRSLAEEIARCMLLNGVATYVLEIFGTTEVPQANLED